MGTPEHPHRFEERIVRVEDAVQEIRFVHLAKTDAQSNGMGILYAGQQRIEHMLVGFRAEAAAEFGAFRGEVNARLGALETEQARQGEKLDQVQTTLAEILRRLSS
jgi:hypothetical protein